MDGGSPAAIAIDRSGNGPVLSKKSMQPTPQPTRAGLFESRLAFDSRDGTTSNLDNLDGPRGPRLAARALLLAGTLLLANPAWAGQTESAQSGPVLPEAPQPQLPAHSGGAAVPAKPCQVKKADAVIAVTAATKAAAASGAGNAAPGPNPQPEAGLPPCPPAPPPIDWFARFLDGPQVRRMTPLEKAWLAMRDVADPFNTATILASSAISVGSDSHSPYGPGMTGFGRSVGVSYTQDMTGEFFGTFLIPSIVHQDPHYHRWPHATIKRRIAHSAYQVVWTQGDHRREMVNYANVVGFAIEDEIANLYVPGRKTNLPSSAERYGTAFLSAPIDNYITEFLPDIARHIHTRVVLIQRMINQVAKPGGPG